MPKKSTKTKKPAFQNPAGFSKYRVIVPDQIEKQVGSKINTTNSSVILGRIEAQYPDQDKDFHLRVLAKHYLNLCLSEYYKYGY